MRASMRMDSISTLRHCGVIFFILLIASLIDVLATAAVKPETLSSSSGTVVAVRTASSSRGNREHAGRYNSSSSVATGHVGLDSREEETEEGGGGPSLSAEQWRGRQRNKNARLFQLQQYIMSQLQLRRKPNVTGVLSPTELEEIQLRFNRSRGNGQLNNEDDDDDFSSKRLISIRPSCPVAKDGRMRMWFTRQKTHYRLFFPLQTWSIDEDSAAVENKLTSAVLWLHLKQKRHSSNRASGNMLQNKLGNSGLGARTRGRQSLGRSAKIEEERSSLNASVYEYTGPVRRNVRKENKKLVKTEILRPDSSEWVSIDLSTVVRRWFKKPNKNFGLEIKVTDIQNRDLDPRLQFDVYDCKTSSGVADSKPATTVTTFTGLSSSPLGTIPDERNPTTYIDLETSSTSPNLDIVLVKAHKLAGNSSNSQKSSHRSSVSVVSGIAPNPSNVQKTRRRNSPGKIAAVKRDSY